MTAWKLKIVCSDGGQHRELLIGRMEDIGRVDTLTELEARITSNALYLAETNRPGSELSAERRNAIRRQAEAEFASSKRVGYHASTTRSTKQGELRRVVYVDQSSIPRPDCQICRRELPRWSESTMRQVLDLAASLGRHTYDIAPLPGQDRLR